MKYVLGLLAGLVWGALAALLNGYITKNAVKKGSVKAMGLSNTLRLLVDVVALVAVFLLKDVLPFSVEMALAGTAAALGLLSVVFAYKIAMKKDE